MRILGGAIVGLLIWGFLFLVLPQEFLGGVVGRPFELDDGEVIIRYPWGMVLMVIGFFALPIICAKAFSERGGRK
jgi:hypothetical protein